MNQVEEEIEKCRQHGSQEEDIGLWKSHQEKFKKVFSSKATWESIRSHGTICTWSKGF